MLSELQLLNQMKGLKKNYKTQSYVFKTKNQGIS